MKIAFYIDELNYRGVANSTYLYALNNAKILKNKSYIFYNKKNKANKNLVLKKFKKKFKTFGITHFREIDFYQKSYEFDFLYVQKGGEKNSWVSKNIKTIIHSMYPQKLSEHHGFNYAFISEWLSQKFSNKKISYVPYIVQTFKSKQNLKKKFNIKNDDLVFGCHGGESSFDMNFAKDAIIKIANNRKDIIFLFLNINKFCNHSRIKFLKGTVDEKFKRKFINTCDYMIYGRSLGESFGLACAEFAIHNKPIISYKFNRHRSHEFSVNKKNFIEYKSYESLIKILENIEKINFKTNKENHSKYNALSPKKVMPIFKKEFLSSKKKTDFSFVDYLSNYLNYSKMNYLYIRHKIYDHFYNYLWKKII